MAELAKAMTHHNRTYHNTDPYTAGVYNVVTGPNNGKLIWRCYVGGPMEEGVPALYGNKVFSHHRNGYFYAIE